MSRWRWSFVGLIVGGLIGMTVLAVGVVKASIDPHPVPVLIPIEGPRFRDVLHSPPLLVSRGEFVQLRYEVVCGADQAGNRCIPRGSVYVRALPLDGSGFVEIPFITPSWPQPGLLVANLPASYTQGDGFDYYAVIDDRQGESMTLPVGGAAAAHHTWVVGSWTSVGLGTHQFGSTRAPDEMVLSGSWGDSTHFVEFGLNSGSEQAAIGPSAFDLAPDGSLIVLDQVNHRLVVNKKLGLPRGPRDYDTSYLPIPFVSGQGDIAVGKDSLIYVLEYAGVKNPAPTVTALAPGGEVVTITPLAAPRADMIRIGPLGPLVHAYPSEMWLPIINDACPVCAKIPYSLQQQILLARPGRTASGDEIVVRASPSELRVALVRGNAVTNAWRVTSATDLGAVPLAEPYGNGLLIVASVWTESQSEFRVLRLAPNGVAETFAVDRAGWADMAPLSRFRLAGDRLYQMRSSPSGAGIVNFRIGGQG
jgi:hypothetical protein